MDTNKGGYSIKVTVCVCLYSWDPDVYKQEVVVEGLSRKTTFKELKLKVCNKAREIRIAKIDPDKAYMMLCNSSYMGDNMTLGSLSTFDNLSLVPQILTVREVRLVKEGRWLNECRQVRKEEEAQDEEEVNNNNCSSREKRPKINGGRLPFAQFGGLPYNGCLEFHNHGSRVPVGSVSKIETTAYSVSTDASVVLVAPNDCIFETLKKSLPTTCKSQYLIVRVSWDVLSYVFLRQLRRHHPKLPFVAVTDLDPHHLDLLTFLDTPPLTVNDCYGWLLDIRGLYDADDVHEVEFADIVWLGLRPSQLLARPPSAALYFCNDQAPPPSDFCKVIRMLEVNPFLRCKEGWLEELECLKCVGKTVLLEELLVDDDFISQKLSQKDWI